ncbi:MAG: malate dehydrogenase (quinone) [Planctomycetales bacterium]|nr:malate dehydrogenase (quinone) [Planctomycetales bacterium]
MSEPQYVKNPDVILIGSGVMSANLGVMLKLLEPRLSIQLYEVTDGLAQESSDGWNNAGTGHAGICELSYTPTREADGSVNVAKAIEIFEQFEQSKLFWSYAVSSGLIDRPKDFINPIPHLSFVHGETQVEFLRARYAGMKVHHFFRELEYSTERDSIASWAPLLLEGRDSVPIAATKMNGGTDVNFGALSRKLLKWFERQEGCGIARGHRVVGLRKVNSAWEVSARDLAAGEVHSSRTKFVFVGAGGGSLPLLQTAGIPEARGLGGFPIGGQWLMCDNPEIVGRHQAKVYGQALDAAPTMAVPHLDTRILDGKKTLLFGPFAAWTTKFLHKKGRFTDLPFSVRPDNLLTLMKIGFSNLDLIRYLIQQGTQSMADRIQVLHVFYPGAKIQDWKLIDAGIRVQAIKKMDGQSGIVHYGTEVITNADHSISALLGASPGASVSVNIMLEVIKKCFPSLLASPDGRTRMKLMIPTYDEDIKLAANSERFYAVHQAADEILQLT